ncbi:MAG: HNH endonuclease [Bacteroidales bacterium]|jgi:5-methylcytosine-specific restriction endonuclease McrA|nr:HNH endonuclease [Bacteroidales bacterium]
MNTNIRTQLSHGSYKEKLFDRRWQTKREAIINRDGGRCVICGKSENLVVHHRQYHFVEKLQAFSDPWDYDDKYLITLCQSCHNRGHDKFEVPIKYV